ncbi:MAG: TrkA family potassium uptake protein, partial [Desulfotomaculaceae bacterium]|nr:TrkA family potassium uptake protein [Desulfotomaculaceae bacterium]
AIRRGSKVILSPGARQVIEAGDILVVVGRNEKLKGLEER